MAADSQMRELTQFCYTFCWPTLGILGLHIKTQQKIKFLKPIANYSCQFVAQA